MKTATECALEELEALPADASPAAVADVTDGLIDRWLRERTEVCRRCGGLMIQTGTCMTCQTCGDTSGCG